MLHDSDLQAGDFVLFHAAAGGVAALYGFARSSWVTQQHVQRTQPIPFSHQHHAANPTNAAAVPPPSAGMRVAV